MKHTAGQRPRWPYILIAAPVAVLILLCLLQGPWAHRMPPFRPDYPREDLAPILAKEVLTDADYDTLFLQAGLGRSAADRLLARGEFGRGEILAIQEQFFTPAEVVCDELWGLFTREDHMRDANGDWVWAPPMADLRAGDIILTFSTHSAGWRHGHAGLMVDIENDISLEAALIGTDSCQMNAGHWRAYSNYLVLRLKDMTPELQKELVDYALEHLDGIPYHLTSGFIGPKAPATDAPWFGVQCDYLVWYAFQRFGYDLDGDGGRLVTTADLAASPLLEVVQAFGVDPRQFIER